MTEKDTRKKKILIVDDEEDLVETLRYSLELEGFDVDVAYNGFEALEKVKTSSPNLILLDIIMPKMDGFEVCKRLRRDKSFNGPLIIMITVRTVDADRKRAQKMGVRDCIVKPFDLPNLIQKIKTSLE